MVAVGDIMRGGRNPFGSKDSPASSFASLTIASETVSPPSRCPDTIEYFPSLEAGVGPSRQQDPAVPDEHQIARQEGAGLPFIAVQ